MRTPQSLENSFSAVELQKLKKSFEEVKPESILDRIQMTAESRRFVENDSFALLIAVIADQSVKSEVAWDLPNRLSKRIGMDHFNAEWIFNNIENVKNAIAKKPALHRFPGKMADYIFSLSAVIENNYSSPSGLLNNSLDYNNFIVNIKGVSGISDKKANFLFLILLLDFHYDFKNIENSTVLFDTHVEKFLSKRFNKKITKTEADEICHYVSPDNPALFCPYMWRIDRKMK
ncbi:hypothetical protein [Sporolactobacillus pectinivorans]|uniref:hypothetical protein n=1 Tax=Sporolactobacillus pectinivorans TaxID=1591408 RepID=UPI000C25C05B|nr:hypothetical protein [Sporolactobacillus pectinivorans]